MVNQQCSRTYSEGGPLCQGHIIPLIQSDGPGHYHLTRHQEFLRCPWHGWEFDIRTGQSWCEPDSVRARTYNVTIELGNQLAKGPFMAETVPVRLEGRYIVVEV